jgi:hypothetical protein
MSKKPFFIGWEEKPATSPVSHSKSRAVILLAIALGLAGVGAALQQGFTSPAKWDFTETTFDGILLAQPYPTLISGGEVYYLVLQNKQAVSVDDATPFHLNTVKIVGTLIEDPDQPVAMIAVKNAAAIASTGSGAVNPLQLTAAPTPVTLRGEIVDSKCAFGAMNPAVFKPHRACAIACLSGDIPPVLVVRHEGGTRATHYLLLDAEGHPMKETAIEYAALPVQISGQVTQVGTWNILRAAPTAITLLP